MERREQGAEGVVFITVLTDEKTRVRQLTKPESEGVRAEIWFCLTPKLLLFPLPQVGKGFGT